MSNQLISDADVQKALDYLRDTAETVAKARAERIYMEEYRKSKKAMIMAEHLNLPVSAQEREAYADPRYIQHLESLRTAIELDEKGRFMRQAADAKIEAWRTMNANYRSMKL
jgi:hypothetical protein|tara:strand:- start:242 stop:577 length:336 start_codon:yes stop_codon:yes gene_type:complete